MIKGGEKEGRSFLFVFICLYVVGLSFCGYRVHGGWGSREDFPQSALRHTVIHRNIISFFLVLSLFALSLCREVPDTLRGAFVLFYNDRDVGGHNDRAHRRQNVLRSIDKSPGPHCHSFHFLHRRSRVSRTYTHSYLVSGLLYMLDHRPPPTLITDNFMKKEMLCKEPQQRPHHLQSPSAFPPSPQSVDRASQLAGVIDVSVSQTLPS